MCSLFLLFACVCDSIFSAVRGGPCDTRQFAPQCYLIVFIRTHIRFVVAFARQLLRFVELFTTVQNCTFQILPYMDLLTGNILTPNNSREVNPMLAEYRPHLMALVDGEFCSELLKGTGEELWAEIKPVGFHVDEFFNVSPMKF